MKTGHEYLLEWFPNYDYHNLAKGVDSARLDYRRLDNLVGYQQRCFAVYWALKGAEKGGIGIDIGCGEVIHPFCFGVDKYCGDSHPDYPSSHKANYRPHMVLRGDKPLPFESDTFAFLISHHSLEHMVDASWTLREWVRIVKPNGILAIVMPDRTFGEPDDADHKRVFTAEEFETEVLDSLVSEGLVEIVELDTLRNKFSFNVVLRKK